MARTGVVHGPAANAATRRRGRSSRARRRSTRRIWTSASIVSLLAFALLIGLAACGRPASDEGAAVSPSASSSAEGATAADEFADAGPEADAAIGEPVVAEPWRLVVEAADSVLEAGGAVAGAGQSLVVVTVSIANEGATPASTGLGDYGLEDGLGTEFLAAPTTQPGFLSSASRTIQPGATATFKIAYEVPDGADEIALRFAPAAAGGAGARTISLE